LLLFLLTLTTAFKPLSPSSLRHLSRPSDSDFDHLTGALLSPILIPRVPGTPNSLKVLTHFQHFFTSELPLWKLSTQNSTQTTPLSRGKKVPFVNFFATRDPPWKKDGDVGRLVLVAHYDSKVTPEGFIGAIDSAVPCAMLLHTARAVDGALTRKWKAIEEKGDREEMARERGVMVLFLDGEEAWENWSDTDSLYGARDLAHHWDTTFTTATSTHKTLLSTIDLFVLFDLLGSSAPSIPSYFLTTHWAYLHLASTFESLHTSSLLHSVSSNNKHLTSWFPDTDEFDPPMFSSFIQDDHIPFLQRGVEILHIIPSHFPSVWHRMEDDGEHLDKDVVKDWGMVAAAWTAGFLELEGWIE
ncbi:hypothetical protein EX30DRAFT_293304, partial [Ascodesmis nigricans]